MPRLTRLRIGALADLAQQLRFAPKKRIIAQLASATALANEIDPDGAYPEDWVVFRITGYRPEIDSPALIVGEALRGDLSAFVERVSDRARLTEGDLPEHLRLDELAARWGVSRKTLERARRQGLIAQRCRDDLGGVHLVFTLGAIERYERRRGESVRAAGAFDRIDSESARRLARVGERAMRRFGWSANEAATRLAHRAGRGRETMRQLLLRSIDPSSIAPGAMTPRQRRIIDRAARRAIPTAVIARRYDRSPDAIRLIVHQRRLSRLRRWRLPTEPAIDPGALDELLRRPLVRKPARFEAPETIGAFVRIADESGKPDAATERTLATAHRALLTRAGIIATQMSRSNPRAADLDRAEADLRFASILRARLVGSELALVRGAIEGRLGVTLTALAPAHATLIHDASIDALIQSAAGFNPARGGRLAAPAGLAINKALAEVERTIRDRPGTRGGAGPDPGETSQAPLRDWTRRVAPWCQWLDLPPGFVGRVHSLPGPSDRTLSLMHALDACPPRTPAEIAEQLGLSRLAVVRSLSLGTRLLRESVRCDPSASDGAPTSVG